MPANRDPLLWQTVLDATQDFLAGLSRAGLRGFTETMPKSMPLRDLPPKMLPCATHLPALLDTVQDRRLALALAAAQGAMHWGRSYSEADFDRRFLDNIGWVELFGTRGHFECDTLACGILVLGPDTHYPPHHHVAEEIYVPLSGGSEWRMGDAAFAVRRAGEIIFHGSNVDHAMRTGAEPLLALYLWRGGDLAQRPTLTGRN